MELRGIGQYPSAQNAYAPQKGERGAPLEEKKKAGAGRDSVEISGNAAYPRALQKRFPKPGFSICTGFAGKTEETGELTLTDEDMRRIDAAAKAPEAPRGRDDAEAGEEAGGSDMAGVSGCVGINAAKLARLLAAAKTRAQVQAVIAKIQADLDECEAGKAQGMDVDEASVEAAERLLQEAKFRLSSAEDREATPQEELASALASLM